MKMPKEIDVELYAPCGFNCISCEKYQSPCIGCLKGDRGKTKAALKCKIKACLDKKKVKYCGRCSEFPCTLIKKHSKKSQKRYNLNTQESAKRIQYTGINKINIQDHEKWTCKECGGIIHFQTNTCSECNKKY
ncbi:DUF3795 domain-containing protein [uncultured Methanobrevibacter sp.]|uniref:DUF3795 domain-containing protein n=1 Tax=uncultured Methanobrevibacter sp. TaxID=253161 RepID=UPI0026E05F15|nr:DUF3795 domain-containing protein [uncultured Methanobrevibacter sp.]